MVLSSIVFGSVNWSSSYMRDAVDMDTHISSCGHSMLSYTVCILESRGTYFLVGWDGKGMGDPFTLYGKLSASIEAAGITAQALDMSDETVMVGNSTVIYQVKASQAIEYSLMPDSTPLSKRLLWLGTHVKTCPGSRVIIDAK